MTIEFSLTPVSSVPSADGCLDETSRALLLQPTAPWNTVQVCSFTFTRRNQLWI